MRTILDIPLHIPPSPSLDSFTRSLNSVEQTLAFGQYLGQTLRAGDILALTGDLGVGKTLLTRGLAQGLGLPGGHVTSPTFSLIQVYESQIPLIHVDLYRLESPNAILQLGLDEYFNTKNIVIIEWADRCLSVLPSDYLTIHLEHGNAETTRHMTVRATGPRSMALVSNLRLHSV